MGQVREVFLENKKDILPAKVRTLYRCFSGKRSPQCGSNKLNYDNYSQPRGATVNVVLHFGVGQKSFLGPFALGRHLPNSLMDTKMHAHVVGATAKATLILCQHIYIRPT